MSTKRYDTNPEKELILEGLEFFESSENPDMVNPKEIKILMDKLDLKDKMSFIYDLISELCSNKKILKKGCLSKTDFISYLEKKLNDSETKEGIRTIYNVFTDSKEDTLPMTNFCRTAREIGDMEKDEELKQLLKEAEMTGKELNFEEFHEIMKNDENNKIKKDEKKYQKQNINKFARKKIWRKEEKEESEPSEEKNSKRSSYMNKKYENDNSNKNITEEYEPKNAYSYRRVKVEQKKILSPKNDEQKEEPAEEKMITVEEIIKEKKVEEPGNHMRYKYKYKNRFRKEQEEQNNTEKEKNEENIEENNINNNENSESKRYHRRYRSNYNNNEGKPENINNNITYNRYRRKADN